MMFRKDDVIREHEMLLSANGIVATTQTLTSEFFQLIYVVPSGDYEKRWVLYDPDLRECIPLGYTTTASVPEEQQVVKTESGYSVSRPYFRDCNWEHEWKIADDSYACPNPNCCLFTLRVLRRVSLVDVNSHLKLSQDLVRLRSLPLTLPSVMKRSLLKSLMPKANESRHMSFEPSRTRSTSLVMKDCFGTRSFAV